VIQGSVLAALNSPRKLVSNASTHRSLPWN
jgi:hypothetical protein